MSLFRVPVTFAGVAHVSNANEHLDAEVFENSRAGAGDPTLFFLGGIGLIVSAIGGFVLALRNPNGQFALHAMTTLPMILAVGMLARGFSLRNLPRRIVVGHDSIEVTTRGGTRDYPWSEIGSASTANVLNTHQTCLKITDTAGKAVITVDESFPEYKRLVELVQSRIDAKPDDTSTRIMRRKAKLLGSVCFVFGCLMVAATIFVTYENFEKQRSDRLLAAQGVVGEAEIVERFVAPNGVTKRIKYRVENSEVQNVEVEPNYWDQLENDKTVPVVYVPGEPDISRLESGEVKEDDFVDTPMGGYLLAGLGGVMSLFLVGFSPFAWLGYDFGYDQTQKIWKLKRYGRVVWTSGEEEYEP